MRGLINVGLCNYTQMIEAGINTLKKERTVGELAKERYKSTVQADRYKKQKEKEKVTMELIPHKVEPIFCGN